MIQELGTVKTWEIETPIEESLANELVDFWERIFSGLDDDYRRVFTGAECQENRSLIYVARIGTQLAGTCFLTIGRSSTCLGGLGGVAVAPELRRKGIASYLCERARNAFRAQGGEALFLGTVNPAAAHVYHRLGWRKLVGTNVMAWITSGDSPEAFLVNYYKEARPVSVVTGSSACRIPMIPLLLSPHDWQRLDTNVDLLSTRYAIQNSCMGLYPRYEALSREGRGMWFAAHTDQGRLVALSTVQLRGSSQAQVDGFAHQNYLGYWQEMVQAVLHWAAERGARTGQALVSIEDEDKQRRFESLGFRKASQGDEFGLKGRLVASVRLEKPLLNCAGSESSVT